MKKQKRLWKKSKGHTRIIRLKDFTIEVEKVFSPDVVKLNNVVEKYSTGKLNTSQKNIAIAEIVDELTSSVNIKNTRKEEIAEFLLKIGRSGVNLRGDEGNKIIRGIIRKKVFEGIPSGKITIPNQGQIVIKKIPFESKRIRVVFNKKQGTSDTGPRTK